MTTPNFYADHLERMVQGYAELAQIDVAKQYTLSQEFNVTRMTAHRAATGQSWSHIK